MGKFSTLKIAFHVTKSVLQWISGIAIGCLVSATQAVADDEKTLCLSREDIYFSCPLDNGKIVSICAHANTAPDKGYVKYRYGLPTKVELEYPETDTPPDNIFHYVNASEGSVNSDILKFKRGAYTYLVTQSFISHLRVLKSGEPIFRQYCDQSSYAALNRKVLIGVKEQLKSAERF